jgi:predicted nucleic acid-binding protein
MLKIFIDTNIAIRFLVQDDPRKSADCAKLFEMIGAGGIRAYTSSFVIAEFLFVLIKQYKFPKIKVVDAAISFLKLRNMTLIEPGDTSLALKLYRQYPIKYGDCLIATQVPPKAVLVTYDEDFAKLPGLKFQKPDEVVKTIRVG